MAVFRVERNTGYTVMSNHHLRNKELTLKAKGLLSQMLSLPEDWDYTLARLIPYQPGENRRYPGSGAGTGTRRVYRPFKGTRRERTPAGCRLCDLRAATATAYAGFTYVGKSNIGKSNAGKPYVGKTYAGKSNAIK